MTKISAYAPDCNAYISDEQWGERRTLTIDGELTLEDLEGLVRYLREVPYSPPAPIVLKVYPEGSLEAALQKISNRLLSRAADDLIKGNSALLADMKFAGPGWQWTDEQTRTIRIRMPADYQVPTSTPQNVDINPSPSDQEPE